MCVFSEDLITKIIRKMKSLRLKYFFVVQDYKIILKKSKIDTDLFVIERNGWFYWIQHVKITPIADVSSVKIQFYTLILPKNDPQHVSRGAPVRGKLVSPSLTLVKKC